MQRGSTILPTPHGRISLPATRIHRWHPKNVHLYKSGVSQTGLTPTGESTIILPQFTCLVKVLLAETQSGMLAILHIGAIQRCTYYSWHMEPQPPNVVDFNGRFSYHHSGTEPGWTRVPPGDPKRHRWSCPPTEGHGGQMVP